MLDSASTPEQKIRNYREAEIELNAAKTKLEKLKELLTLVSSSGSLLGFVGGSQAIAVWGIIIVLLAGFVFLSLYMRVLIRTEAANGFHAPTIQAVPVSVRAKKAVAAAKGGDG